MFDSTSVEIDEEDIKNIMEQPLKYKGNDISEGGKRRSSRKIRHKDKMNE